MADKPTREDLEAELEEFFRSMEEYCRMEMIEHIAKQSKNVSVEDARGQLENHKKDDD